MPKTDISLLYGQYNSLVKNDNNITISQTIPFPTVFSANAALGNEKIKSSQIQVMVVQNELVFQVKTLYTNLQYLYSKEKLLLEQDSINMGFVKSAILKYKTGEGNLLAKVTAETQLKDIQNLLAQNQSDIEIYTSKLQILLSSGNEIQIADRQLKESRNPLLADSIALNENPNLAYLRQQVNVAAKLQRVELAKALPDLTLGYFNQSLTGIHNNVLYGNDKRFQGFQVGLAVPIFYRSYSAKGKAAEIGKDLAQNELYLQKQGIVGHYQQAIKEYAKHSARHDYFQSSAMTNAAQLLKNSTIAYQHGEIGYSEYLINLKQVNTIKENRLLALLEVNQSINQIEFLTGNIK